MKKENTYCLFCKGDTESKVAQFFNSHSISGDTYAIAPTKIIAEKRQGKWCEKQVNLIPNYVFVYSTEVLDIGMYSKLSGAYCPLQYDNGQRELARRDYEYAKWIQNNQGKIKTSKYIQEGKEVKIISGPLLNNIGLIKKVDKHKRRIWVEIDFDSQRREVVLSAECIEQV